MSRQNYETYDQICEKSRIMAPSFPLSESLTLSRLIETLSQKIDLSRLLSSPKILQSLKALKEKFPPNSELYIPKKISKILEKITCITCQGMISAFHKCNHPLCPACIEKCNYECQSCGEQLSQGYLYKLYGHIGKCMQCGDGPETECKHLCLRCVGRCKGIYQHAGNECIKCKECFIKLAHEEKRCDNCHYVFKVLEDRMTRTCSEHYLCLGCSEESICKEICVKCGKPLKPKIIYEIFKYIHEECKECQQRISVKDIIERPCCARAVCHICVESSCSFCGALSGNFYEIGYQKVRRSINI